MNDVEKCKRNGWTVGTRLVGDEGHGPEIIEITAISETMVIAKMVQSARYGTSEEIGHENVWSLDNRKWRRVKP